MFWLSPLLFLMHVTDLGCCLLFMAKCSDWFHNDKVTRPPGWDQILMSGCSRITATGLIKFIKISLGRFPGRNWLKFMAHKSVLLFSSVKMGAKTAEFKRVPVTLPGPSSIQLQHISIKKVLEHFYREHDQVAIIMGPVCVCEWVKELKSERSDGPQYGFNIFKIYLHINSYFLFVFVCMCVS